MSGDPFTVPGPILTSILYPIMVALGTKDPGLHKVGSKYNHLDDVQGIPSSDFEVYMSMVDIPRV